MNAEAPSAAIAAEALPTPSEAGQGPDDAGRLPASVTRRSGVPLTLLAVCASLFVLHWASPVLVPLMLGLVFSYALGPAVNRLQRLHLPRAAAAGLVLSLLVGGAGWTAYSLSDDATRLAESLPEAAQKIRQAMRSQRGSPLDKVQQAATQLEKAAQEGSSGPPTLARGVTRVQIEPTQFNLMDQVRSSMPGVAAGIGQATVVLFVTFFLLASGDSFRRKIVRLAGPTMARRKLTVQALDDITAQVQRYLLIQVLISAIVGVATGLAFHLIGLENAAVWGVLAFGLNFVPYLGAIVLTAGAAVVGFLQFGSGETAALVASVSIGVHIASGNLLTPWLTSRASRLNALTVFVGMIVFGWLWGVWGLVLGVPILLIVKAVCDRVDGLWPVGELLGR